MSRRFKEIRDSRNEDGSEGFTLIELLIVIVVLGILAAVVVFALGSVTGNAKSSACQADAKQIITAVQTYNAQNAPTVITTETPGAAITTVTVTAALPGIPAPGASVTYVSGPGAFTPTSVVSGTSTTVFTIPAGTGIAATDVILVNGISRTVGTAVSSGSGWTAGAPSTYANAGTQAALLVSGGYLSAWPSTNNGYSLSLSSTSAGHVVVYVPANAVSGVDYANETPVSGTTAGTGCFAL